ncbi:VCBS repeat-containing protein [Actinocorallia sp. API 0066]|uniref:FG-GAP repeat domain-containing protein n=1 Tax=Actinocorallia sp. API 0066 TaxID=2896846 RepID=UPI001E359ABE|nr:VCBS repeat-containing protein [Actinocorallia sp. API 0066]MCD0451424.1 VCBS repeat-containing protein [Actinocorallia sp. API 0066]
MKRIIAAVTGAALVATAFTLPRVGAQAAGCDSTARADFDGDGNPDLVLGDPGANLGDKVGAGQVTVIFGDGDLKERKRVHLTAEDPEAGAGFGYSVAVADVNGDACLDLVVGAPWAAGGRGSAEIFLGSPEGLKRQRVLTPEGDAPRTFGFSVAARAAHGAHPATIAVGTPHETVKGLKSAGAVHLYFCEDEDAAPRHRLLTQDDPQAEGVAEAGDLFGWAVALGAVMGDRDAPDLLVSEPGEDVAGQAVDAGSFSVVEDVTAPGDGKGQHWHYGNLGIGSATEGGRIGWSLAYVEDGDSSYVAAGVPGQDAGSKRRAGIVALLRSTGDGLTPLDPVRQRTDGVPYEEAEDQYGWSVALTAEDGVKVAVGVPFDEAEQSRPDNGWVHLVSVADRNDAILVDALNSDMPGDAGPYDRFGWSVGFVPGALVIGVPDDQENPGGSVILKPLDGSTPIEILPEGAADQGDFGAGLAATP